MKTAWIAAAALLLASTAAHANHYSDFYVIPVASHTPGQNNTMWMSDIAIQNFQSTALTVQLSVIESGDSNLSDNVFPLVAGDVNGSVTVPANGSLLLTDVLNGYRGMTSSSGAILIGADRPFTVTSRSYNQAPNGTVGQSVPAARDFLENTVGRTDLSTSVVYLPGLKNNDRYRTNLGMVIGNAGSSGPLTIQITLRNAAGDSIATKSVTVTGGAFTHMQFPLSSITDRTFEIGSATVRIAEGNGAVLPYASVIDNRTADAVFITTEFPDSTPFLRDASTSMFRQLLDRMRTTTTDR